VSEALKVSIGVIAGALVTGGVQSAVAHWDRRVAARSAARLLYVHLYEARQAVRELSEARDWDAMITDWEGFAGPWEKHNEALSRTLSADDFRVVALAFSCIASLARGKAKDGESETLTFSPPAQRLAAYTRTIQAALEAVNRAAGIGSEKPRG